MPTPWKFHVNEAVPGPYKYMCGTTRINRNGYVALEAQGPDLNSAFIYDENGEVISDTQPPESLFVDKILPYFKQKTGAQIEKYGFMVVSREAINLNDYLLIND